MDIDIPTANCPATAEFYATLFGWDTWHEPRYSWFTAEHVGGGFPDLQPGLQAAAENGEDPATSG